MLFPPKNFITPNMTLPVESLDSESYFHPPQFVFVCYIFHFLCKPRSGYMRSLMNDSHVNKSVVLIGWVLGIEWAKQGQIWACLQSLSLVSNGLYTAEYLSPAMHYANINDSVLYGVLQFPLQLTWQAGSTGAQWFSQSVLDWQMLSKDVERSAHSCTSSLF